jgi:hypothetical protein
VGDSIAIAVFDRFALGCGEIRGFAFEEGGRGNVVLGVVGVFPDEQGGCGLDYVFATKEDADEAGCWESFMRTIFSELQCEVGEAGLLLVMR